MGADTQLSLGLSTSAFDPRPHSVCYHPRRHGSQDQVGASGLYASRHQQRWQSACSGILACLSDEYDPIRHKPEPSRAPASLQRWHSLQMVLEASLARERWVGGMLWSPQVVKRLRLHLQMSKQIQCSGLWSSPCLVLAQAPAAVFLPNTVP